MSKPKLGFDIPSVLVNGSLSGEFRRPWDATVADSSSITTVVSGLDEHGIHWLHELTSGSNPPMVRVVLLVHATCPTRGDHLAALVGLVRPPQFQVWILPVRQWGQRCSWVLAVRRLAPTHVFWNGSAGNFGLSAPAPDEAHAVSEADPIVVDQFLAWFSSLAFQAAPLSAETATIPALVPAQGTKEAAQRWDEYEAACRAAAEAARRKPEATLTEVPKSAQQVEEQIRQELKIPKSDPILQPLVCLFEQGDLVTIDKGSRIPPLEVPIKAEWFGIPSFREVGVVSREVRYKISILDDKTNKQLDARRKGTSELREKFSFPLADGSRWMPHKAKLLFEAELKRLEEEGKKLLGSLISGSPDDWVQSKRDLVTRDANRQYEEFHAGKPMPASTIDEILNALTERFKKATSGNFLPKVGLVRTSFRLSGDSAHVSDWATARTLLRAIAEYPRAALKSRAYFLRGLKVSEKDLLNAMNVAEDRLLAEWFQPDSLKTAQSELDVLAQIDESERTDRDKCALILDLLHRTRPIKTILHLAQNKAEDLNVVARP
jgi:hypothetical protein